MAQQPPGPTPFVAQVPLAGYTTLGLGGPARHFAEAADDTELVAQVWAADERGEPLLVLGGGSNLVVADEGFPGTVVHVATRGIRREADGDGVLLTVAAGEDWDTVVAGTVSDGLAGLECLSGIPGLAGATPIQNVGAYGQEVAQTLVAVRGYDRERGEVLDLTAADCGFGYRTSAFKRSLHSWAGAGPGVTGRFVVLGVTFRLARSAVSAPVRYAELARALGVAEGGRAPLGEVRSAVLALRRGKGMVLDATDPDTRSAGSFFTNPVLDLAAFAELKRTVAATLGPGVRLPTFPAGPDHVKIPAAWLIEHSGFTKGYPGGDGARISTKHTLALVNPGGATTVGLLALAREIAGGVRKAFAVDLAPEPILVGADL
ncbi:MAG TPA: UDP-N-acetylmuramate dehydrogenase [Streptosporangiaceae bacterium]|nr:UDP-N-acetylmuramate dehydrogenase [Streptosporangiaceae bacterium]